MRGLEEEFFAQRFIGPDEAETLSQAIARNVRDALSEDLGPTDLTGNLVQASRSATARVRANFHESRPTPRMMKETQGWRC